MNNSIKPVITGEYKDTIKYSDGRVEVIEGHNLIVDGIYNLITSLFAQKSGYKGLSYWAIGQGQSSWNDVSPEEPNASDKKLVDEIGRIELTSSNMEWITEEEGTTSPTPTNKLKVKITVGNGQCVGSWREFGLFGGNATSSKDSGIMINHKHHGLIVKTSEMEIEREIIFTFSK